jgi:diguanylate cyclase (GGDEF)-like protein
MGTIAQTAMQALTEAVAQAGTQAGTRAGTGRAQPGILLVDDDVVTIRALSQALQDQGHIHFAKGGHEALRLARTEAIDLILLDAEMPLMNGFQVCQALKADPALAHIPIIFVTSHADQDVEHASMAMGAADFIAKPIRPVIVTARVATQLRLKQAADQLRELALSDSITGLPNRRAFDDALAREWGRSRRCSEPLSVVMVGIEGFKAYNASHGRRRGDDGLVHLAQVLADSLKRPADLAARYSGATFALLLPCTGRVGASEVVRRILDRVASPEHGLEGSVGHPSMAIAIGFSSYDEPCDSWISDGRQTRQSQPAAVCAADIVEAACLAVVEAKQAHAGAGRYVSVYRALVERISDQPPG